MNEREEDFWTLDAMRSHGGRFVQFYAQEVNELPDYLNDLNAMYEAERTQTHGKLMKMRKWCIENTCLDYHAKASQRAEAFLRTIGKWEEEE